MNIEGNNHEERTFWYLKTYGSITSLQAIRDLGYTRLSDAIYKLRKKGHVIESIPTAVSTRWNNKDGSKRMTTVSEYKLINS